MGTPAIPHFDTIIIGSGSIGTPAALYLAMADQKTLVLDATASSGQGSNKHAIGGIRATHSDPAKISLCMRSIEIFSTWQDLYGDDLEWNKGGYTFVAYHEREENMLKDLLTIQKSFGLNIDWYQADEMLKFVPGLNPRNLRGGTFSPDDGNASPLLTAHAFFKQAVRRGVEFRFNEPVTELLVQNGRIVGVKTSKGAFAADVVINAAGANARFIGELAGLHLPVQPDSHEAAITEPLQRLFHPMVVDIRSTPGSSNFYFYQHYTGQIMFCITPSPNIWGNDTRETSEFLPMVARRMVEVMPALQNIRVRRTWRGLYPMTPDGSPIVGWSREVQGLLLAVGMCGQGFMLGPGLGELLARLVTQATQPGDELVLKSFSPDRSFIGQEKLK
jgi:sarcosine oxidase, subunit beta